MRNTNPFLIFVLLAVLFCSCSQLQVRTISIDALRDKIKGGWAGEMIGVSYGGPTEFRYNSVINEDDIKWDPTSVKRSIFEDDLYVQMSFMMTMDKYGIEEAILKRQWKLVHGAARIRTVTLRMHQVFSVFCWVMTEFR